MADQWQELNSDDRGNTIDHTGRIVNDDGAEPHGPVTPTDQMDKHTPGPWEVSGPFVRATFTIKRIGKPDICNLYKDGIPADEVKANATLIAAAPDLLKACRALADKIAAYGLPPEYLLDEWRAMRSAIAKALGQAQE